ncbi:MAG: glutamate-1-semialdehyde 2,1-aminomutase [Candidatus Eremiobacteraeota bacterium]|nr:glutamate-1-semialdehyde 2,1-aminomutase [Candidatus Eremiobacteraeota bacterium]
MKLERSISAFARARRVIAGGVNSPVRALGAVGLSPVFMKSGAGATLYDLDGHEYIDYVMSWGALLLGHAHPAVCRAIANAVMRGTSLGTPTEQESELAELIASMMPSIQRLRFVSSGTEATLAAVRLARGFTQRSKIVKFAGCYHGHGDSFLIAAGSGALTHGVPDSPGVTEGTAKDTIVLPFNDAAAIEEAFQTHAESLAAAIVEPYPGNMGLVLPKAGYLQRLRELCTRYGALLIFDEVMSGFRAARGGAQGREGIVPDLTTLGKVIGGGLPVGAFGGRADVMAHLAPDGPVYQAGTLSGNPLSMAAGLATLNVVAADATLYDRLEERTRLLTDGLSDVMQRHQVPHHCTRVGSMFTIFFSADTITDLNRARASDRRLFARYFGAMLDRGVYLAPSPYETNFLSVAHSVHDVERTLAAADASFAELLATA